MSKTLTKRTFIIPTAKEARKILAAARKDPDAQPLTTKQLKEMVPLKSLLGRPKSDNKKLLVSVRYSPEVVAYFKSTGAGWQSRMDGVLLTYVSKQKPTRNLIPPGSGTIRVKRAALRDFVGVLKKADQPARNVKAMDEAIANTIRTKHGGKRK